MIFLERNIDVGLEVRRVDIVFGLGFEMVLEPPSVEQDTGSENSSGMGWHFEDGGECLYIVNTGIVLETVG